MRNAIRLWAERTTRPETNAPESKLGDNIQAVNRFFTFVDKHPGEVTLVDVGAWRAYIEAADNQPVTVYTRIGVTSRRFLVMRCSATAATRWCLLLLAVNA